VTQETAMANELGTNFIDLTGIYAGVPDQIFTDYAHLTPLGNELLAKHVVERILPLIPQAR
jgi:lysophospholipase L1-like esterase